MVLSFLSSRLSVEVSSKDGEYRAGDTLEGTVQLRTLKGVEAREVKVSLCCAEWVNNKENGGKEGEGKEIVLWEKERKLGGKHRYSSGDWKFEFKIPESAAPSITPEPYQKFPKEGAGLKWFLHAHMDVPASIDLHAYKQIFLY
jgi:hypothetical protein